VFRLSETVSIDRAPADVFDFVADLRNFPLWRSNLASSTIVSERSTGVGARCDEEVQVGPRRVRGSCEITASSAGQEFSFRAISPGFVYDGSVSVEPAGDGCRFTLSGDVSLSGFMRLLEPVLERRMRAGVRSEVAAIKSHMELVSD